MSKRAFFTSTTITLLFLVLFLSPREAHADAIAVTSGSYTLSSPFLTPPRFISVTFDLRGDNFRASGGEGDSPSKPIGTNCSFPCTAGSTFSLNALDNLFTPDAISALQVGSESHIGFFGPSELHFITSDVTIPLDAPIELVLTAPFTMNGSFEFTARDAVFGFESQIFGSGLAEISLKFSPLSKQYEIQRAEYDFQPTPEPATLFLLVSGVAGLAARYRLRRPQNHSSQS
jgi:hypothetical protein